jgi:hypothetical protein
MRTFVKLAILLGLIELAEFLIDCVWQGHDYRPFSPTMIILTVGSLAMVGLGYLAGRQGSILFVFVLALAGVLVGFYLPGDDRMQEQWGYLPLFCYLAIIFGLGVALGTHRRQQDGSNLTSAD